MVQAFKPIVFFITIVHFLHGECDNKNDLHEDNNQYDRENNPYIDDVGGDGSKYDHDILKDTNRGVKT